MSSFGLIDESKLVAGARKRLYMILEKAERDPRGFESKLTELFQHRSLFLAKDETDIPATIALELMEMAVGTAGPMEMRKELNLLVRRQPQDLLRKLKGRLKGRHAPAAAKQRPFVEKLLRELDAPLVSPTHLRTIFKNGFAALPETGSEVMKILELPAVNAADVVPGLWYADALGQFLFLWKAAHAPTSSSIRTSPHIRITLTKTLPILVDKKGQVKPRREKWPMIWRLQSPVLTLPRRAA